MVQQAFTLLLLLGYKSGTSPGRPGRSVQCRVKLAVENWS